jgi:hypothetical protein
MKTLKIMSISGLLWCNTFFAQTETIQEKTKKWGIEVEGVQPFLPTINIIRIGATRTITKNNCIMTGDLLFGMYIRPNVKHDVVEKINEYMVFVGYRNYFWKGLHLEAKSNMGYAWGTRNLIDQKDYETPTWFWEANLGYKLNFRKRMNSNLYVVPQVGMIGNIIGNLGPRGGKPDNFIQGNLQIGINF